MPLIFKPLGLVCFFGFLFLFWIFFPFFNFKVLRFNLFQGQILTVGELTLQY